MKKALMLAAVSAPALAIAAPASASIIEYDVTDATDTSCPHGLWTNNALHSDCSRKFSFQDGTTFTQDTDAETATFSGTAINDEGQVATLDLFFSGFQDELTGSQSYKGGGGPYDPSTMDFYSNASGTITIDGAVYSLNPSDPLAGTTTLQIGPGANDKTGDFGGSAWLNILDPSGYALSHWDINFDLTPRPGTPVPAPGGLAIFALALMGLWAGRRRKMAVA